MEGCAAEVEGVGGGAGGGLATGRDDVGTAGARAEETKVLGRQGGCVRPEGENDATDLAVIDADVEEDAGVIQRGIVWSKGGQEGGHGRAAGCGLRPRAPYGGPYFFGRPCACPMFTPPARPSFRSADPPEPPAASCSREPRLRHRLRRRPRSSFRAIGKQGGPVQCFGGYGSLVFAHGRGLVGQNANFDRGGGRPRGRPRHFLCDEEGRFSLAFVTTAEQPCQLSHPPRSSQTVWTPTRWPRRERGVLLLRRPPLFVALSRPLFAPNPSRSQSRLEVVFLQLLRP